MLQLRGNKGVRLLHLGAKKTGERSVVISQATYDAVKALYSETKAGEETIMFKPGEGANPVNKWVMKLSRFFKMRGMHVQSHDFRATTAT